MTVHRWAALVETPPALPVDPVAIACAPRSALLPALPLSVVQALDDAEMPATARLLPWQLRHRLDLLEWRPLKWASVALEVGLHENTVGEGLKLLTHRGYLRCRETPRREPNLYRFPWSRITLTERVP